MALVSFRPAHLTLSAPILKELSKAPALAEGMPTVSNVNVPPWEGEFSLSTHKQLICFHWYH